MKYTAWVLECVVGYAAWAVCVLAWAKWGGR